MPRKDPITGCDVMTPAEFWRGEADHEGQGRSAGDLQAEFFDEMERERIAVENNYRLPSVALETLKNAVGSWNTDDMADQLPLPAEVLEVKEAGFGETMSTSRLHLVARCRTEDGRVGTFTLDSNHWAGSFYEPPDHDEEVSFKEE